MRLVAAAAVTGSLVACGSASVDERASTRSTVSSQSAGGEASAYSARIAALEAERQAQSRRIQELEARLADGPRDGRDEELDVDDAVSMVTEEAELNDTDGSVDDASVASTESRPVLRLYGAPSAPVIAPPTSTLTPLATPALATAPRVLPPPPAGALGRLPVTSGGTTDVPPIPEQPLSVAVLPAPSRAPGDDSIVREYQSALGFVTSRNFQGALTALGAFLRDHPDHPYADNAMYWRAEVLYATREFAAAEREFVEMIRRFPAGNKVADALLRLGFCRQRLGDVEGARAYFRRVRSEFPGTVAARLAAREDT